MSISLTDEILEHRTLSLTGVAPSLPIIGDIHFLSNRNAMGLPKSFVSSSLDDLTKISERLRHEEILYLQNLITDQSVPFLERFVAGNLLSLFGDTRFDALQPEMLCVPAAKVRLGLDPEQVKTVSEQYKIYGIQQDWIEKETPSYEVELKAFALAKFCVTNLEYMRFLKETGYGSLPASWSFGRYPSELANHPVYNISLSDIGHFISWLNQKTNRKFRLPTEAEWEYAAAGQDRLEFPWGNKFTRDCCNTLESGILQTTSVGIFPKGLAQFGHADMAGNVEEYVADLYEPYPGGAPVSDNLLQNNRRYQITRGGCFSRFRDLARTRRRHGIIERDLYAVGFRLAESLDEENSK